jgi:hypothetical protein
MTGIEWICPHCYASNCDDPDSTALPLCEACDSHVHWDEIFSLSPNILKNYRDAVDTEEYNQYVGASLLNRFRGYQ